MNGIRTHLDPAGLTLKAPRRILVVVTLRIGDVLMATPVIRSLKLAWPQAEIDALVFEGTQGVLQGNPDLHRVITVPARPKFWAHLRLILKLFRRYDIALTTLMGDRATLYVWFAGKMRYGMQDGSDKHGWKRHLLSHWAQFDHEGTHTLLTNLGLMDELGIKRSHDVVASWGAWDEAAVARVLPFDAGTEAFAVLHLYPKFPYKMWRSENWIELAHWLRDNGMRAALTGSADPDELAYIEQLFRAMPPGTVNMAGRLSLAGNAFLISRARCYVGPDTALTHMAAALGTPTVALFGPSNPVKWGPWPKGYAEDRNPYRLKGSQRVNNVALLQGEGDCVPCIQEGCDRHAASRSACLQNLQVSRVVAAIHELSKASGAA